jgi:hypothetical protein
MGPGPTGGKKDTTPPKVRSESPANKSVNFSGKKISISFDEFIQLDNAFKEVIITPVLARMPDISVSGKTVIVNFRDIKLQPNTTYLIQFGNAIKDYHEGNSLKNYRYIFSTGSYLDSGFISGKVVQALSGKAGAGYKVELYKQGNDSGIFKSKPLYYNKTDSNGFFRLDYLPKGSFLLYALKDENDNFFIDDKEYIGFKDSMVYLDSSLKLKDSIKSFEYIRPQILLNRAQWANHTFQLKYNHELDSLSLFVNGKRFFTAFQTENKERDSFTYWMSEDFPEIRTVAYFKNQLLDTIIKATTGYRPIKFIVSASGTGDNSNFFGTPLIFNSSTPIAIVKTNMIVLRKDTSRIKKMTYNYLDSNHTHVRIYADWEENGNYSLNILPGALVSLFGDKIKDTIKSGFVAPSLINFGNLEMTIIADDKNYIFQLVNESDQVIFYKNVSRETLVKIPFVNPGIYRVRVIKDSNHNGQWDGGDVKTKAQPEEVYYYPKPINIKANWELAGLKFDVRGFTNSLKKQ